MRSISQQAQKSAEPHRNNASILGGGWILRGTFSLSRTVCERGGIALVQWAPSIPAGIHATQIRHRLGSWAYSESTLKQTKCSPHAKRRRWDPIWMRGGGDASPADAPEKPFSSMRRQHRNGPGCGTDFVHGDFGKCQVKLSTNGNRRVRYSQSTNRFESNADQDLGSEEKSCCPTQ